MDQSANPKANQILAALPVAAYRRLLPELEETTLRVGDTLFYPTRPLAFVYFPITCVISLRYAVQGDSVTAKAWPVGCEGIADISVFLGGPARDHLADVQIGGIAYRLPAAALQTEFKQAGALQQVLLRYVFALITQASQLGLCNHYHPIDQRLCRFLSRLFDRVPGNKVFITQQRIGELLGVRRATITVAASQLQAAGIIDYHRGHMELISRKKLDQHSCSCGTIIRRAFAEVSE